MEVVCPKCGKDVSSVLKTEIKIIDAKDGKKYVGYVCSHCHIILSIEEAKD